MCVENKKSIKEQRGKDQDKDEKKNKYTRSRLMNGLLDEEQRAEKHKSEFD